VLEYDSLAASGHSCQQVITPTLLPKSDIEQPCLQEIIWLCRDVQVVNQLACLSPAVACPVDAGSRMRHRHPVGYEWADHLSYRESLK
jgi:hypothetical protein